MARRHSNKQDSLELLLDTICNTFGGVLFIAILVVLLLQQTSDSPRGKAPSQAPLSEVEILSLAIRLDEAMSELQRISDNQASQDAIVAELAPTEIRDLIQKRREATTRQNLIQSEVDKLRLVNAKTSAQTNSIRAECEQVRISVAEAMEKNRKADEIWESERKSRLEEVRLPVIRSSFSKREVGLIVRYGRLYVWHRYGMRNDRLGLNTDEFVVVSEDGNSLVTRPVPTRGIVLDGSDASRRAIQETLKRFNPNSFCLAIVVRHDSFGAFKHLRDQAIETRFDYRLIPMDEGTSIIDRGGENGKVQ